MKAWFKYYKLLSHLTIWAVLLFVNVNYFSAVRGLPIALERGISILILYIALFYFNWTILIPRFYIKKRYLLYGFWVILVLVVSSIIRIKIEQQFHIITPVQKAPVIVNKATRAFFLSFSFSFFVFIVSTMLRMADFYARQTKQKEILLQQKTAAELQFLKAQINPHFLFNALNNIYALVLTKSENAAEALMSLSQLLRYIIYDSAEEKVSLEKELKYLDYYIELESLRLAHKETLTVEVDAEDQNLQIMPLTFIPFIENSFKHSDVNKDGFIKISIRLTGHNLHFICQNSYSSKTVDKTGGIGLENSKKRLEIVYGNKYALNITNKTNVFTVDLKLEL